MSPDARRELEREWSATDLGDLAVALVVALLAGGFLGWSWGASHADERIAQLQAELQKKPKVIAPLTQWQCDAQELREYRHACSKRKQMELIEKINPPRKGTM